MYILHITFKKKKKKKKKKIILVLPLIESLVDVVGNVNW